MMATDSEHRSGRPVWVGLLFYVLAAAVGWLGADMIGYSIQDMLRGSPFAAAPSAIGPGLGLMFGGLLFGVPAIVGAFGALVWCWKRPGRSVVHAVGWGLFAIEILAATIHAWMYVR